MDDDFFDFLTEEEKAQLAPASISELDSFKEYKNLVDSITSREELINLRYPQLTKFPIAGNILTLTGGLAVPEWFPDSYKEYAYSIGQQLTNVGADSLTSPSDTVVTTPEGAPDYSALASYTPEELTNPETWQEAGVDIPYPNINSQEAENYIGAYLYSPEDNSFIENPNYDMKALLGNLEQAKKTADIEGEDWYTEEREAMVRKFFDYEVDGIDSADIAKNLTWSSVKDALIYGADPDKVFEEFENYVDIPMSEWRNMVGSNSVNSPKGARTKFNDLLAEHRQERFKIFSDELEGLRGSQPEVFQQIYALVPTDTKLRYLNDIYQDGQLTKEAYEGLFISEFNNSIEREISAPIPNQVFDPNAVSEDGRVGFFVPNTEQIPSTVPRIVEVEGKFYLNGYDATSLEGSAFPFDPRRDLYEINLSPDEGDTYTNSLVNNVKGDSTGDFDPSGWDFFDPIMSVFAMIPGPTQAIAAVYTGAKALSGETLRTEDYLRAIPGVIDGINTITAPTQPGLGGGTVPVPGAPPTIPTSIPAGTIPGINVPIGIGVGAGAGSITAGDKPIGVGDLIKVGSVIVNPNASGMNNPVYNPNATDVNKNGIPDLQEGIIVNFTGQMQEAGVVIPEGAFEVNQDGNFVGVNGQVIGFGDVFSQMLNVFREQKPREFAVSITEADDPDGTIAQTVGAAVYNAAKFLVDDAKQEKLFGGEDSGVQQAIAMILSAGGDSLNSLNGFLMSGDENLNRTEIATLARNLIKLGDSNNTTAVKEAIEGLDEIEKNYEPQDFFENRTANALANAANLMYQQIKEYPLGVAVNIGKEVIQEVVPMAVGGFAALGVKSALKAADIFSEAGQKLAGMYAGLSASAATDIAEAGGSVGSQAFNQYVDGQKSVYYDQLTKSLEFKALYESGASVEEQKAYLQAKIEAKTPEFEALAAPLAEEAFYVGSAAALASMATGGLAGDKTVIKSVLGDSVVKDLKEVGSRIVNDIGVAGVKEGFSEGLEEFFTSGYITYVERENFDPRITLDEVHQDAAQSAVIGAITGAGVTTTTSTGSLAATGLTVFNPEVNAAINDNTLTTEQKVQQVNNTLNRLGINPEETPAIHSFLLNRIDDPNYVTPTEAADAFIQEMRNAGFADFTPTEDQINKLIGEKSEEGFNTEINQAVDDERVKREEDQITAALAADLDIDREDDALEISQTDDIDTKKVLTPEVEVAEETTTDVQNTVELIESTLADAGFATPEDITNALNDLEIPATQEIIDAVTNSLSIPTTDDIAKQVKNELGDLDFATAQDIETALSNLNIPVTDDIVEAVLKDIDIPSLDDISTEVETQLGDLDIPTTTDISTAIDTALENAGIPSDSDISNAVKEELGSPATTDEDGNEIPATGIYAEIAGLDIPTTESISTAIDNALENAGIPSDSDIADAVKAELGSPATTDEDGNEVAATGIYAEIAGLDIPSLDDISTEVQTQLGDLDFVTAEDVETALDSLDIPVTEDIVSAVLGDIDVPSLDDISTEVQTQLGDLDFATAQDIETALDSLDIPVTEDIVSAVLEDIDVPSLDDISTEVQTQLGDLDFATAQDIETALDSLDIPVTEDIVSAVLEDIDVPSLDDISTEVESQLGDLDFATAEDIETALDTLNIPATEDIVSAVLEDINIPEIPSNLATTEEIQAIANLIGKPAREVTDADIDFVADTLAQQEVISQPTPEQAVFDVNQDGIIDINDQTMLEQALTGQDVALQGDFAPTGIFAELDAQRRQRLSAEQEAARIAAEQQAETQRAIEQQTEQQLQTEQNISTQIEATRQRQGEEGLLRELLAAPTTKTAQTQQQGVANIDYLYDIGGADIFAPTNRTQRFSPYGGTNVVPINTPQQQQQQLSSFLTPKRAKGGIIERNEALLKILGDY